MRLTESVQLLSKYSLVHAIIQHQMNCIYFNLLLKFSFYNLITIKIYRYFWVSEDQGNNNNNNMLYSLCFVYSVK